MKKLMTLLLGCLMTVITFGQKMPSSEITISTEVSNVGDMVEVSVYTSGLEQIEAITLHIEFDDTKLEWLGCYTYIPNMYIGCYDGLIGVSWCSLTPIPYLTHKLMTFHFLVDGSSDLTFVPICEIIKNPYIPITPTYTNGRVIVLPLRAEIAK